MAERSIAYAFLFHTMNRRASAMRYPHADVINKNLVRKSPRSGSGNQLLCDKYEPKRHK